MLLPVWCRCRCDMFLNCSVFLASWCRKWTQCWRYVWEVHHVCVYMEDQWWTVRVHMLLNTRGWGVWVCVWKQRAGSESLLGNKLCVQAQPVKALPCVTHQFCHGAGVEDQGTHHLVQLQEEVWEIRHGDKSSVSLKASNYDASSS